LKIDGVLYIPGFGNKKQREEFKKVFARSINLDKVDKKLWDLKISMYKDSYPLELIFENKVIGLWVVYDIPFKNLNLRSLESLNEKAEKLFTEEWFYGVKDYEGLEALLGKVDNEFFGIVPYPTTISKATAFWFTIATKQMFNNGNKRTALLAGLKFLKLNGYDLDVKDDEELYNISMNLANKIMTEEELREYILEKSKVDFEQMKVIANQLGFDN